MTDISASEQSGDRPRIVMFVDISGSSRLFALRGDAVALELTIASIGMMEEETASCGGVTIKRTGDGILAAFDRADDAVATAVALQNRLYGDGIQPAEERLHVRAGIHCGPAALRDGDLYGDAVNVAARISTIARIDEILLSEAVYSQLTPSLRPSARPLDAVAMRGHPLKFGLYEFVWRTDGLTVALDEYVRGEEVRVELASETVMLTIEADGPPVRIGRDAGSHIRIEHSGASRHHAEVSLRGGICRLSDSSTNGTYVEVDGASKLRVLREEVTLSGSGSIHPGSPTAPAIRYRVLRTPKGIAAQIGSRAD